jgi:uncharacterized protein
MTLYDKQLYIKQSTIPHAGKGLFTKVFIPKGSKITEYKGEILTWKEVEKMADYRNGYVFYFSKKYVIDAWKTKKGVAHYANDARGIMRIDGVKNNAEYDTVKRRCYIVSTRDIAPKSEILVGYGAEYWQVIRYNIRLDEKNKAKKNIVELPHHHAVKRTPKHRYASEIPTSSAPDPKH